MMEVRFLVGHSNMVYELDEEDTLRHSLIRRIFFVQIILIIATSLLVLIAIGFELGSFWFAFVSGIFGASIAMLRMVTRGLQIPSNLRSEHLAIMLSPLLYGGLMAGVAYFIIVSGLVAGTEGSGIITSNLFPKFTDSTSPNGVQMLDFLAVRPVSITDATKLIVWCFLAGYSESFVTGILRSLEGQGGVSAS
jgi:hypothetical protein